RPGGIPRSEFDAADHGAQEAADRVRMIGRKLWIDNHRLTVALAAVVSKTKHDQIAGRHPAVLQVNGGVEREAGGGVELTRRQHRPTDRRADPFDFHLTRIEAILL